jgi:hypothetical protein
MGVVSGKCEKIRRNYFLRGKQLSKLFDKVRIFAVPKRGGTKIVSPMLRMPAQLDAFDFEANRRKTHGTDMAVQH